MSSTTEDQYFVFSNGVWHLCALTGTSASGARTFVSHDGSTTIVEKDKDEQDQVPARRRFAVKKSAKSRAQNRDPIAVQNSSVSLASSACDLTTLEELSEPLIVRCIEQRFGRGDIYTDVGNAILVAVNPYEKVAGVYGTLVQQSYEGANNDEMKRRPHVYAVAERAYRSMRADGSNQSIVVSGESGAGKTESTKHVLNYLAFVSSSLLSSLSFSSSSCSIEQKLIVCSPLVEAFGNAKTARNDNSSRFGKFVMVYFSGGKIVGAHLRQFLLEKSRVVRQTDGERNYHVFYQLLAGASDAQRRELMLFAKDASAYRYLRASAQPLEGVDDAANFGALLGALRTLGFDDDDVGNVLRVIAAVLLLGQIDFVASPVNDGSSVADDAPLRTVSSLLGASVEDLRAALCFRSVGSVSRSSLYAKPQSVGDARSTRDALAKLLYAGLFAHLIERINVLLLGDVDLASSPRPPFIGVLDIFGFEDFEHNSLEQLLINYANEALHSLFNRRLFVAEQAVYASEGLDDVTRVSHSSNAAVVDMLEQGIMATLVEECRFPRGSDANFLAKVVRQYSARRALFEVPRTGSRTAFIVKHYAGDVRYESDMLDKCKDTVNGDIVALMANCAWPFGRHLAAANGSCGGTAAAAASSSSSSPAASLAAGAVDLRKAGAKKRTVVEQFRSQMSELLKIIESTTPWFLRCIKSNSHKRPMHLDGRDLLRQLAYTGILATVAVRKQGFPHRMPFADFLHRFRALLQANAAASDSSAATAAVVRAAHIPESLYRVGRTRIFFKDVAFDLLEAQRALALHHRVVLIQKIVRGFLARRRVARERLERERIERERVERERVERERIESERVERERVEREHFEKGRIEQERIERERLEKENLVLPQQQVERRPEDAPFVSADSLVRLRQLESVTSMKSMVKEILAAKELASSDSLPAAASSSSPSSSNAAAPGRSRLVRARRAAGPAGRRLPQRRVNEPKLPERPRLSVNPSCLSLGAIRSIASSKQLPLQDHAAQPAQVCVPPQRKQQQQQQQQQAAAVGVQPVYFFDSRSNSYLMMMPQQPGAQHQPLVPQQHQPLVQPQQPEAQQHYAVYQPAGQPQQPVAMPQYYQAPPPPQVCDAQRVAQQQQQKLQQIAAQQLAAQQYQQQLAAQQLAERQQRMARQQRDPTSKPVAPKPVVVAAQPVLLNDNDKLLTRENSVRGRVGAVSKLAALWQ
jgi:myosin heavy subunit